MSRIYTIASGSSGNCTYIGHERQGILIDAGISAKAIAEGLEKTGVLPSTVSAIFITHEHIDHVSGLRVFSKKYKIPVFASAETATALITAGYVESGVSLNIIDGKVCTGDMQVERFSTSHDCAGSSGYTVTLGDGRKCAVCTDLGIVTDSVRGAITGCTALVLESNHDVTLLQRGSYPESLKRRIMSNSGHLSNTACSSELGMLVKSGATRIILGHLSRENNRPEIARSAAAAALMDHGMTENEDYLLYVAPPKNGKMVLF